MIEPLMQNPLAQVKRIVIKVGSALLMDAEKSSIRRQWLLTLAGDIAHLQAQGKQVIVVSSGATALGRQLLNYGLRDLEPSERQASAACGQILLMQAWQEVLASFNIVTAQVLITADDTEKRRRFLNVRNTVDTLIKAGVVPVINENDTITAGGSRVGDNDRLAARVAQMINASLLVLLSDVDGLYTADPSKTPGAQHLPLIPEITKEIRSMAGTARSASSSGGMKTKIEAAEIATASGCHMVICHGHGNHPLKLLESGGKHSLFLGKESPLSARKHWIVGTLQPKGALVIDDGAAKALQRGNSLLPKGVQRVEGVFDRGDAVWIQTLDGVNIAKGLSSYNSEDAQSIKGSHSEKIKEILGFKARDVLVHRDDMVML